MEDLRGQRLRAYNALTSRFAELMGAVPVTVQAAEVAQAFATNVISAMLTSAQTGVDTSAWDYARVFTDVGGMRVAQPGVRQQPRLRGAGRADPRRRSRRGRTG